MKKSFILLLFISSIIYGQQETIYRLKGSGKKLSKAQVDSLSAASKNSLQYSMQRIQGQTVVEIDLQPSGDQVKDKKTFSAEGAPTQSNVKKTMYKDSLGNSISADLFKEALKSGKYSATYRMEGDNTTFFLVNKMKAEKEFADNVQSFKNKLTGTPFPSFILQKLDGNDVTLASLAGKITVVNFWFIGCKPCLVEMPQLNKVVGHYKGQSGIQFLAPAPDDRDKLKEFLNKHHFSYEALSSSKELTKKLNVYAYPTHLIINPSGIIRDVIVGAQENIDQLLIEAIDKVASE